VHILNVSRVGLLLPAPLLSPHCAPWRACFRCLHCLPLCKTIRVYPRQWWPTRVSPRSEGSATVSTPPFLIPPKACRPCGNGGFLAGKDSALLLEGFVSPAGAAFQMDAFRAVSQVPIKAALDTHYHFDHSSGNCFYGANNVPVWAHTAVARRIVDTYGPMQGAEKSVVLAPLENRVKDAKSDLQKQHKPDSCSRSVAVRLHRCYQIAPDPDRCSSNRQLWPRQPLHSQPLPRLHASQTHR